MNIPNEVIGGVILLIVSLILGKRLLNKSQARKLDAETNKINKENDLLDRDIGSLKADALSSFLTNLNKIKDMTDESVEKLILAKNKQIEDMSDRIGAMEKAFNEKLQTMNDKYTECIKERDDIRKRLMELEKKIENRKL